LPAHMPVLNPLDTGAGYSPHNFGENYYKALLVLGNDPDVDMIVIVQDAQSVLSNDSAVFYTEITESVAKASEEINKPIIFFSNTSVSFHEGTVRPIRESNIPLLQGTRMSLQAIKHLSTHVKVKEEIVAHVYTPNSNKITKVLND